MSSTKHLQMQLFQNYFQSQQILWLFSMLTIKRKMTETSFQIYTESKPYWLLLLYAEVLCEVVVVSAVVLLATPEYVTEGEL